MLCNSDSVMQACEDTLGIHHGQTTKDGLFTMTEVECLGACDIAPMASVNGDYLGPLSEDDCRTIVDDLLAGRPPLPDKNLAARPAAETLEIPE